MMELPVLLEESGTIVTLIVTQEDAIRAQNDASFLEVLVRTQTQQRTGEQGDTGLENEAENLNKENLTENVEGNNEGVWEDDAVFLFLDIYQSNEKSILNSRNKKQAWEEIAKSMQEVNPKYKFTGIQCSNKISGLKRTFKNIKDQKNKSGNSNVTWPFYSILENIFGQKAYMQPVATASSEGPLPGPSTENNSLHKEKKRKASHPRDEILESILQDRKKRQEEKDKKDEAKRQEKREMHEERMKSRQELTDVLRQLLHKK